MNDPSTSVFVLNSRAPSIEETEANSVDEGLRRLSIAEGDVDPMDAPARTFYALETRLTRRIEPVLIFIHFLAEMTPSALPWSRMQRNDSQSTPTQTKREATSFFPLQASTPTSFLTPRSADTYPADHSSVHVTPPTPPRLYRISTNPSPESPGTLATRRAGTGQLPPSALLSLNQMRFEGSHCDINGLGVGPGSPGFAGMETTEFDKGNDSTNPGMLFRMALGLEGKGVSSASPGGTMDLENTSPTMKATSLRHPLSPSPTQSSRKRLLSLTGPGSPLLSPDAVKIPPSLRGSKLLDKLNLSSPPSTSRSIASPPSPLIIRSSAYLHYSNTGPLTPLTPSHIPPAPRVDNGGSTFEWNSYSLPSPSYPDRPLKSIFTSSTDNSPARDFFSTLPTPPAQKGDRLPSLSPYNASPTARGSLSYSPLSAGQGIAGLGELGESLVEDVSPATNSYNPFFV